MAAGYQPHTVLFQAVSISQYNESVVAKHDTRAEVNHYSTNKLSKQKTEDLLLNHFYFMQCWTHINMFFSKFSITYSYIVLTTI